MVVSVSFAIQTLKFIFEACSGAKGKYRELTKAYASSPMEKLYAVKDVSSSS